MMRDSRARWAAIVCAAGFAMATSGAGCGGRAGGEAAPDAGRDAISATPAEAGRDAISPDAGPAPCPDTMGTCGNTSVSCERVSGLGYGEPVPAQGRCTAPQIAALSVACGGGPDAPDCIAARSGSGLDCGRCVFGMAPGEGSEAARGRPSPVLVPALGGGVRFNDRGCVVALAGQAIPAGCGAALVDEDNCTAAVCISCEDADQRACRTEAAATGCKPIAARSACVDAFYAAAADGALLRACAGDDPAQTAVFVSYATALCGAP